MSGPSSGGNEIDVIGRNFMLKEVSEPTCDFEGAGVVPATVLSNIKAICTPPPISIARVVNVKFSLNG